MPPISESIPEWNRIISPLLFGLYIFIGVILSKRSFPPSSSSLSRRSRWLYIWLIFDAGIHTIHETIFLYQNLDAFAPVMYNRSGKQTLPRFIQSIRSATCLDIGADFNNNTTSTAIPLISPILSPNLHIFSHNSRSQEACLQPSLLSTSALSAIFSSIRPPYISINHRQPQPNLHLLSTTLMMWISGTILSTIALILLYLTTTADGGKLTKPITFLIMLISTVELLGYWELFVAEFLVTGLSTIDFQSRVGSIDIINIIPLLFPVACLITCYRIFIEPDSDLDDSHDDKPPECCVPDGEDDYDTINVGLETTITLLSTNVKHPFKAAISDNILSNIQP